MKFIILLFLFVLSSGCANYLLKERCEATNWFNYSQGVAFSGRYLEEDGFVKDCKGVDRINSQQIDLGFKLGRDKMCTYSEITQRGKDGEPVFFNFCDGLSQNQMRFSYQEGLKIFCTEDSGIKYGKSGRVYKKVCPMDWEVKFLKGYVPGRIQYLKHVVLTKNNELSDNAIEANDLLIRESQVSKQYGLIPEGQSCSQRMVYDEDAKKDVLRTICTIDSVISDQRSSLISQLDKIRSQISQSRKKKAELQEDIKNAEAELLILNK